MKTLTIDFETYYDRKYSLSKQTTEEYIRDPQFDVIGVAVKVGDDSTRWYSGSPEGTKEFLEGYDWENCIAVAHNARFDMAILNWRFGIRPKRIADTLSMARAIHGTEVGGSLSALAQHYQLGKKGTEVLDALNKQRADFTDTELEAYAGYCINDVELTHKLFHILGKQFPLVEFQLIDLTVRMFTEPVLEIDSDLLQSHLLDLKAKKAKWLGDADVDREKLMSNLQFAELLKGLGVEPPTKISLRTGKEALAFAKTDEGFKALQDHDNPVVRSLVEARLGVKSTIDETRTERFISIGKRGKLPIPLRYYAAHTGRWGGDDKVNMQNLPRGSILKKAMCAPKGYKFIDCDSSQIEARTLAWLAEEDDLVEAFDRGDDVYKIMASAIYNKPESEISKDERFVGKTTILGAGYGMGHHKFKAQLKSFGVELDEDECGRIISVYRSTYSAIPTLWRAGQKALTVMMKDQVTGLGRDNLLSVEGTEGIRLPNGLYVRYPNLREEVDETGEYGFVYDGKRGKQAIVTKIYGGKLVENICQAVARIIIGEQLIAVSKKQKVVMTVHDAVGSIVPEAEVKEGMAYVEKCLRTRPTWAPDLPLDCEGGVGDSYGACS